MYNKQHQENKSPGQAFKSKDYIFKDSTLGAFWYLAFRDHDGDGPGNETEWKHHNINMDIYIYIHGCFQK